MADAFREVDEALREDRAVTLAKRYGPAIAVAALIIIGGVGGWTYWQAHAQAQAEQRTEALTEALGRLDDGPEAARQALADVAAQSQDGQAMLARFYEAQILVDEGDSAAAAQIYDQLSGDASVGQTWRNLAAMRAAILVAGTADPGEMRGRLSPFLGEESPWRFTAAELMALAAMREGKSDEARTILEGLQDDVAAPASLRQRAGQLIDSLPQ